MIFILSIPKSAVPVQYWLLEFLEPVTGGLNLASCSTFFFFPQGYMGQSLSMLYSDTVIEEVLVLAAA